MGLRIAIVFTLFIVTALLWLVTAWFTRDDGLEKFRVIIWITIADLAGWLATFGLEQIIPNPQADLQTAVAIFSRVAVVILFINHHSGGDRERLNDALKIYVPFALICLAGFSLFHHL